jgi:hypothetical protein
MSMSSRSSDISFGTRGIFSYCYASKAALSAFELNRPSCSSDDGERSFEKMTVFSSFTFATPWVYSAVVLSLGCFWLPGA